ncbi:MAG: sporulation transcription factor Spo0A [Acholeplasmatales bacterium]|nr:sporulation transcription factor Spo0A [Acholeplasmatales bacterium]
MAKTRVIVADDNKELVLMISEFLKMNNFDVVGQFSSGNELLNYLQQNTADLLLLDIFMPERDGISVLEEFNKKDKYNRPDKIIMLSAFNNESLIARASELGADYFIIKPIDLNNLLNSVNGIMNQTDSKPGIYNKFRTQDTDELAERISNYLHNIGIPSHIKGYKFLTSAVIMVYQDFNLLDSITKKLYPSIAETYGTTDSRVERAIRHAIEVAWKDPSNADYINKMLQPMITFDKKPTNSEFIASLTDLLRFNRFSERENSR